ncbi:helix-turn-helix domain-containing protein [Streptomyces iconiensis]|uniref:Helix-turn-helix transcriptional regulator n=1 Tax=Streptomyces iconiensis TaxID=1384038 RepID=A0ABT7A0T3_9ACTN|nr:helix-turn-helix transcriptional regulator [Streptomyces iconiensis]MDJ1134682.1 helix-turn-helix transcriptional regulator [Streptomyces iconiensis]
MERANGRQQQKAAPATSTPDRAKRAPRTRASAPKAEDRPGIWTAYGKVLRRFRKRAGFTQELLAYRVGYSLEQTASIEQGRRPAKAAFTVAAERELDAGGVLEDLQEEVDFAKLPAFFRDFGLIELDAVSRFDYDPLLVPGLLQTPEYARALFEANIPALDPDTIEDRVDARISRQKLLTKTPMVDFSFVIGEAALRNVLGSRQVMRAQQEHLLAMGELRNVSIQVMPMTVGFHPGLNGPIVTVETCDHQHFAYFESQGIGHVVSVPAEVSMFALRYGKLRSQALNEKESAAFIRQLAGER